MEITKKERLKWDYIEEQMKLARKAAEALNYSYSQLSKHFPLDDGRLSSEVLERLDALTSRFARLADILIQKILRGLDSLELVDEGSILDRLHRAEKRGIIKDFQIWKDIRELRNQIAHDYVIDGVIEISGQVFEYAPELLLTLKKIEEYIKKLDNK